MDPLLWIDSEPENPELTLWPEEAQTIVGSWLDESSPRLSWRGMDFELRMSRRELRPNSIDVILNGRLAYERILYFENGLLHRIRDVQVQGNVGVSIRTYTLNGIDADVVYESMASAVPMSNARVSRNWQRVSRVLCFESWNYEHHHGIRPCEDEIPWRFLTAYNQNGFPSLSLEILEGRPRYVMAYRHHPSVTTAEPTSTVRYVLLDDLPVPRRIGNWIPTFDSRWTTTYHEDRTATAPILLTALLSEAAS